MPNLSCFFKYLKKFQGVRKISAMIKKSYFNSALNKGKTSITHLFNDPEVLSYLSDNAKLFVVILSGNSDIDGSRISLLVYPSRSSQKLHDIHVTPKMVEKVIAELDSSLPFKRQPHKMIKHTQTIRRQQPTNCLSVFDHFVGLSL